MPSPLRFARVMVTGLRQSVARTPAEVGLAYEDVGFTATDGVDLRGWFIPAGTEPAPAVVWVHGWPWNRLGNVAGGVPWPDRGVDHLPATKALHDAGFHVLMFDLANHGESGRRLPLTFGVREARDYAGAVAYLRSRPEVEPDRIGAIGMSAGGSTILYGTAACQPIRAMIAIQPTTVSVFTGNMARSAFGRIGPFLARSMSAVYWLMRAPDPRAHDPAAPAHGLGDTVVQFVQGTGDQWGEMPDVERMSAATPHSLGVIAYPSEERYGGYQYIDTHKDDIVGFFRAHL
ncbi:alpha/beta fold hydrolase [Microbacterium sp. 2FI]|uniref:alpha/beta hydrolase n=1 Tax=Microbacterium sp. 2FI TaxID=2502193 RepID=UPI001BB1C746|nr:alpha/beta fold hydrolase [Microbacterium sp. 2FI]